MKKSKLKVSLATDEQIIKNSNGAITSFNMFNFKFKVPAPTIGGLFCQRIFGPVRDYVCGCGTEHPRIKAGTTCGDCGVEITSSYARKEYMAHIDMGIPYVNPMGMVIVSRALGISESYLNDIACGLQSFSIVRDVKGVLIDYDEERFSIVNPKITSPGVSEILGDDELTVSIEDMVTTVPEEYSQNLSIYTLIAEMNNLNIDYEATMRESELKEVRAYYDRGRDLMGMFNSMVPVNPPDHRPMTASDGNVTYHPKNYLYSRLVRVSLRIRNIQEMEIEEFDKLIQYEAIMAQRLVRMLMVTGTKDYHGNPIPSILGGLKSKGGLLRWNCLGKRVDYSGRSVIVSDPKIPLDSLRLPFKMAYELFKPFILGEIKSILYSIGEDRPTREAYAHYKDMTALATESCFKIASERWVLFNRAPSLHRYSVQAYKVILCCETKCIGVPPMGCHPQNADFDGDQVAIHSMLGDKAKEECHLYNVENNLMSSSDYGQPLYSPSHEQTVGLYLMTRGS